MFATPETQIGFHPDAGASFYLSHLPGYLGKFLSKYMSRKERLFIFILLQLPFCTISLCLNLTLISLSHLAFHCWHLFSSISIFWTLFFFFFLNIYPWCFLSQYGCILTESRMSSISHCYFTSAKFVFHHVLFAGEYLALTGEKLNGVEMIACGLATHYSLSAVRPLGLFSLL